METISNPLLRVGQIDRVAEIARAAGAALVVDNTFGTPLLARPLELGADFSVHSLTKYLAGHGDVMGGIVLTGTDHVATLRSLGRTIGPVLGPFECYLAMRGIKTFPLRGIKDSPPYLHDGRLLTLEDVVEFFNLIQQLNLSSREKKDLVAFLRQL